MTITISSLFLIAALVAIVVSALGKCPLWVGVVLLWVVVALQIIPR